VKPDEAGARFEFSLVERQNRTLDAVGNPRHLGAQGRSDFGQKCRGKKFGVISILSAIEDIGPFLPLGPAHLADLTEGWYMA